MGRLSSELVEARESVERSRQAGVRMEEELQDLQEMLRKRQEELESLVQQLERVHVDGVTAETQVSVIAFPFFIYICSHFHVCRCC